VAVADDCSLSERDRRRRTIDSSNVIIYLSWPLTQLESTREMVARLLGGQSSARR